jgi:hypothetical protein
MMDLNVARVQYGLDIFYYLRSRVTPRGQLLLPEGVGEGEEKEEDGAGGGGREGGRVSSHILPNPMTVHSRFNIGNRSHPCNQ